MRIGDAKDAARDWVREHAADTRRFAGAYFAGSTTWLADDDMMPVGTDVDVMVVLTGSDAPPKLGKFMHGDALLEVTYLAMDSLRSPEAVLGDYHLAPGFREPHLISDPTGALTELQVAVAAQYARRRWVRARCRAARSRVEQRIMQLDSKGSFADQFIGWLFPTGVTTHVLLVAGLQNPTVRRRYVAVRDLLVQYGRVEFHESLLELLGCAHVEVSRVEHHLEALARMFDATAPISSATPFAFASDLSEVARPTAIDASRELIERGQHREAMFWIGATASRCQNVLQFGAPAGAGDRFGPEYADLVSDFGIASCEELRDRADATLAMLPKVWDVAESIIAENPEIRE